jgi:hypothetical protein
MMWGLLNEYIQKTEDFYFPLLKFSPLPDISDFHHSSLSLSHAIGIHGNSGGGAAARG